MSVKRQLEEVLRERIKQHQTVFEYLQTLQMAEPDHYQMELAVQHNLIDECETIARLVLGYEI